MRRSERQAGVDAVEAAGARRRRTAHTGQVWIRARAGATARRAATLAKKTHLVERAVRRVVASAGRSRHARGPAVAAVGARRRRAVVADLARAARIARIRRARRGALSGREDAEAVGAVFVIGAPARPRRRRGRRRRRRARRGRSSRTARAHPTGVDDRLAATRRTRPRRERGRRHPKNPKRKPSHHASTLSREPTNVSPLRTSASAATTRGSRSPLPLSRQSARLRRGSIAQSVELRAFNP